MQSNRKFGTSTTMKRAISVAAMFSFVSCGSKNAVQMNGQPEATVYAEQPYNFRLSLTDAPNDDLKSVFVNVKHAELRLAGGGKEARVIVAKDLGMVDLLTLQNGVTLPMADLSLPEAVTVTQIRLVLNPEENHLIKADGSRCDLATPSQQKTGIKFLIHKGVTVEPGYSYSIVADFDAKKSIVLKGNGGCLLKPVLKLKSATRIVLPEPTPVPTPTPAPTPTPEASPTPAPEPGPTPLPSPTPYPDVPMDGDDFTQVGDETGFDSGDDTTVPVVDPSELNSYF